MNDLKTYLSELSATSKPVETCVIAFGITLATGPFSLINQLPESAWTWAADRPIECLEDSTAPLEMPRHSIMGLKGLSGVAQFAADEGAL